MSDSRTPDIRTSPRSADGFTRRTTLKAAAAGTAALALPQVMTRAAHAAAPLMEPTVQSVHREKLGEFDLVTVLDATVMRDGLHPTFGQDQPAEDMAALLIENKLPIDRAEFYFTPVLINTGREVVLFDTGLGGDAGQTARHLAAAGYAADAVDVVVLTHFHPDHIGGLSGRGGAPTFPSARYVAPEAEYAFWTGDVPERLARVSNLVEGKVVPLRDRMTMVSDDGEVVPGIRAVAAHGHTPGHTAFHIESGGRRLLLTADTANHFVASLQRPDWQVRFDMDKDAAAATRKRLFDMVATDGIPFSGYHMPFPAVGFVEKMGPGYRYIPETYQLDERPSP